MSFRSLQLVGLSPLLCLIAALWLSRSTPAGAQHDAPTDPSGQVTPDEPCDEQLIQRHNELAPRVKQLWQEGRDREALQGLEELLQLYQEFYPVEKYPAGHLHIVLCYRDLCRVTDKLREYEAQWKYCQDGLAMCRRLFPPDQFPHSNPHLASMLANMGNILVRKGRYAEARGYYEQAIRENRLLEEQEHRPSQLAELIRLNHCVAKTYDREGVLFEVSGYTRRSVELAHQLASRDGFSLGGHHLANCLLLHGRALRDASRYAESTEVLSQAIDKYFSVFLVLQTEDTHLGLIDCLAEFGALQTQKGDYESARNTLQRANDELNALANRSSFIDSIRLKITAQLLRLAYTEGSEREIAEYRSQLASLVGSLSMTHQAAIDPGLLVDCKLDLGLSFQRSGQIDVAKGYFRSAKELLCVSNDSRTASFDSLRTVCVECYLGSCYQILGDFSLAYSRFSEGLSVARKAFPRDKYPKGHAVLSMAIECMANHLWQLGETDAAVTLFRELCGLNDSLYPISDYPNGHRLRVIAHTSLGQILLQETNLDQAAIHLEESLWAAKRFYSETTYPDGHDELSHVWRRVAMLEIKLGRFESAHTYFQKALESYQRRYHHQFPEGHLMIAFTLSDLGRAFCAAGDHESAEEFHRRSLAMRRRLYPVSQYPNGHPHIAVCLRDLANIQHVSGRFEDAFQLFAQSTRMEHAIADSFLEGGSEALLLNMAARRFRSLDYVLDSWRHTDRPASDVYQYVWLRRGFVPRIIAQRNQALRKMPREERSEVLDEYIARRRELSRALLVSASQDDDTWTTRWEGMQAIHARKERLEHQLSGQYSVIGNETPPEQYTPQQLAEALPVGSVMVDYVKYGCHNPDGRTVTPHPLCPRMMAFVIAHGSPVACVDLGDADKIESVVQQWRQAVLDDREDASGTALHRLVWEPVRACFPADTDTVYVAPDGGLSLVAWGALPSPATGQPLIETYAIAVVPHGPFLVEQLQRDKDAMKIESNQVLAVGNVDYGVKPDVGREPPSGLKRFQWLPLRGSAVEIEAVSAAAGGRGCIVLTGTDATPQQILSLLPRTRWAHFATHGFFVDSGLGKTLQLASDMPGPERLSVNPSRCTLLDRSPFVRSGLALAGANEIGELDELGVPVSAKGILTAEEIVALDCHRLELVVLSACESGRGDVVHGDGVFGIQTAFHIAGARNVIATLWRIDDQSTSELMSEFYRLLWEEGRPPLRALREAQRQMIRREMASSRSALRGPDLSAAVPLPTEENRSASSVAAGARKWAGFVLSGPGF